MRVIATLLPRSSEALERLALTRPATVSWATGEAGPQTHSSRQPTANSQQPAYLCTAAEKSDLAPITGVELQNSESGCSFGRCHGGQASEWARVCWGSAAPSTQYAADTCFRHPRKEMSRATMGDWPS